MRKIFVAGIGTAVGKTVVSSIIAKALHADYWKPLQAGNLRNSDARTVERLVSDRSIVCHPEAYRLSTPISPHAAARRDHVEIDVQLFTLPSTSNTLVIEGAGGLLVPLNRQALVIDLIGHFEAQAVLVSRNYLGSINHTLLSVEALERRNIVLLGIVFNGKSNPDTEEFILGYTGCRLVGKVQAEDRITADVVRRYAREFAQTLVDRRSSS